MDPNGRPELISPGGIPTHIRPGLLMRRLLREGWIGEDEGLNWVGLGSGLMLR